MMQVGLLLHDSKPVGEAVPLAAVRYAARLGGQPNVCFVHPSALPDGAVVVGSVRVESSARVLKNHFWIGKDDSEPDPA